MDNPKETNNKADLVFGIAKKKIPSFQQFKYLGSVLSLKERWILDVCGGILILALLTGAVYTYFFNTEQVPQKGGEYSEGLVGMPEKINPILAQTNDVDMDLSYLVFSGLFKYNENQELENDLATNYEISEDLKTYTFYLRRDAKWHDGEPLNVDDVLFTIASIQDVNYQSPLEPSLRGATAEKIDDYSFKMTLQDPFSPFLSSMTFGILPKHIWYDIYKISPQNVFLTEYNIQPIGSGQYMFDSLVKDKTGNIKSYQLIPFPDYYGAKPNLQKLNFTFYFDVFEAVDALANKKIDGLFSVPLESKEDLVKRNRKEQIYNVKLPQYTALFFNQDRSDVLDNDSVRQALVWGVDRTQIINDVLNSAGEPVYTPILKGYIGHNADVEKYGFEIEKGKSILEEGGWKVPEGEQYRKKGDQVLEFTIVTVDQPEYLDTLDILKKNWESMGFKINIDSYAVQDITDTVIKDRNYEALLFGEIAGTDPDPYAFWHSSQQEHPGLALSIFYQKDIDNLLETARQTTDAEQRRLKYFHFQNVLAEEIPAIFLYQPTYIYAVNKKIKGVTVNNIPLPSGRFAGIEDWYIETQRIRKKK
ncbi:MAG: ABC transporter substrate-binding protein [Patescibacteria group bacterium]|jgi:peptide/nickel transport system substrate-binding protein